MQAAEDNPKGDMAFWAEKELRRVIWEEKEWRFRLQKTGILLSIPLNVLLLIRI